MLVSETDFNRSMNNFKGYRTNRIMSASTSKVNANHSNSRVQFQQAAMTSIYKSIKNNDISYLTGGQNDKTFGTANGFGYLPALPSSDDKADFIKFDEKAEVSKRLADLRKKYDQLKDVANRNEKEIEKLKIDERKLADEEIVLEQLKDSVFHEEDRLKEESEMTGHAMQEAEWTKKSYLHIRQRLKKDQIANRIKTLAIEKELEAVRKCHTIAEEQKFQITQYNKNANKIFDQLMDNVGEEYSSREEKMHQFKQKFTSWEQNETKRMERTVRERGIAEHAIYDKDAFEKKLWKLLYVQKFLGNMFKSKMEREMKKFSLVEKSFSHIKAATGQTEMKNIVSKFLTREQTYGELLGQIANHEKKIEMIMKRNEALEGKLENLKQEMVQMDILIAQKRGKSGNQEHFEFLKKVEVVEEGRKQVELVREKLYEFCIRTLDKFSKVSNDPHANNVKHKTIFSKNNIIDAFRETHKVIMHELRKANNGGEDVLDVLYDVDGVRVEEITQDESFVRRNIRIKPTTNEKQHHMGLSHHTQSTHSRDSSQNSRSTPHNASFAESEDDTPAVDEKHEEEYFNYLRGERKADDLVLSKKRQLEKEKEKAQSQRNHASYQ